MTAPPLVSTDPTIIDIDEVRGYAAGELEPMINLFARLIGQQGGAGAALAVYVDGRPVIDLVGGDYDDDSLQLQYSVSKLAAAIAAAHAHASGALDLDAPVAQVWPAFDRPSTRMITTRMILSHRAGLPGVEVPLTVEQVLAGAYTDALERQDPYWEPGSRHGYHSFSYGPLLDGIFEHALGRTVGRYVDDELARPLGLDLWFGCPPEHLDRVAPYTREFKAVTPLLRSMDQRRTFADRGSEAMNDFNVFNRRDVLGAGWPNTNVVCTARSMARLVAATLGEVDGHRALEAPALATMIEPTGSGIDWVLQIPISYGSGVQLPFAQRPMGGPGTFGHEGAGGCLAYGDPQRGLSVAFCTRAYPALDGGSPLATHLLAGLRHLLEHPVRR